MILKFRFSFVFHTLLISFYFTLVESVPEDYCLSPLNTSDCGRPPTPVFYYYKPGSRCEIKFWRGCPTENLFNTEYHCSHHCIGKLWSSEQDANAAAIPKTSKIDPMIGPKYRCDVPIDTSKCKQAKQFVYTYDNETKKCTEVTYYGCPTENKFRDKEECEDACEISKDQWEQAVNNLDLDELNKINEILDEVKDEKEDLKKKVVNSKVRPHTVSDDYEVTDPPKDETNKVDDEPEEPENEPEEPTDKPEEPTEKPEEPTEKPEETNKGEESQTTAEAKTTVASTGAAQENTAAVEESTTNLPGTTKRTRRKRVTKTVQEGDVVRGGANYDY